MVMDTKYTNMLLGRITALLLVFWVYGCSDVSNGQYKSVDFSNTDPQSIVSSAQEAAYLFGFDQRSSLQEDARQYQSLLEYLESETGLKFKLVLNSDENQLLDGLGTGDIAFAAIGAVTFILGNNQYGLVPVARGLNHAGRAEYQSAIVVKPGSTIQDVGELKGKNFAFGSLNSTQGHLIPRIVLGEFGISLAELGSYSYTGSHRNCANSVISQRYDACGMQDTMARELEKSNLVKVIHYSQYYPSSGIAASKNLPPEVVDSVRTALLSLSSDTISSLHNWHLTEMPNGFVNATEQDYAPLKQAMLSLKMLRSQANGSMQ